MVEFNESCQGIQKVIEYMGFDTGSRLITKSRQRDSVRVKKMAKKCGEKRKKRTKTLRVVKKGHLDEKKELESKELYIARGH